MHSLSQHLVGLVYPFMLILCLFILITYCKKKAASWDGTTCRLAVLMILPEVSIRIKDNFWYKLFAEMK